MFLLLPDCHSLQHSCHNSSCFKIHGDEPSGILANLFFHLPLSRDLLLLSSAPHPHANTPGFTITSTAPPPSSRFQGWLPSNYHLQPFRFSLYSFDFNTFSSLPTETHTIPSESWLFISLIFFFPALLSNNWHITLCNFKLYNLLIWYIYILQNDYHHSIS